MAQLIQLPTKSDPNGNLTVIEKLLPFEIKRVYYIYGLKPDAIRGKHRHHKCVQALICVHGSCVVSNHDGVAQKDFKLNSPDQCLILETKDWHTMHSFQNDAVLLLLASDYFDPGDYINAPYE